MKHWFIQNSRFVDSALTFIYIFTFVWFGNIYLSSAFKDFKEDPFKSVSIILAFTLYTILYIGFSIFLSRKSGAGTGLISKYSKNQKPERLDEAGGKIVPGKTSAWITVIGGILMLAFGLVAIFSVFASEQDAEVLWVGVLLSLMGLAIAGFMSPSLFSIHDIEWDQDGVTGAASTFGPTLGMRRHKINWNEIVKRGETVTQYWYLETNDKRRVYWSYLYSGYGEFDVAISEKCPNLKV